MITKLKDTVVCLLTGAGQVMFQKNALSGLLFIVGIFWGACECGMPHVGWGALVGLVVSTLAGNLMEPHRADDRDAGLWGFNGILAGCALPTFLGHGALMWVALVVCAALTSVMRKVMNLGMARYGINSLTAPFVASTWIILLAAQQLGALSPAPAAAASATLPGAWAVAAWWLKGISQVFLVDSWVTGAIFLVALAVSSWKSALWAAASSAIALGVAWLYQADSAAIAAGLYGFSPVLTGIAVGCVFGRSGWRQVALGVAAVVVTVFVQAAMNALFVPFGLPTLTAPFCLVTWLFLFLQVDVEGGK